MGIPCYRELTSADVQSVQALRLAVIATDPDAFTISPEQEKQGSIEILASVLDHYYRANDRLVLGAFSPGLVAMVGAEPVSSGQFAGALRIWGLNVLIDHRRQGIATCLIDRVAELARATTSSNRMVLEVTTGATAAHALYRKLGFAEFFPESDVAAGSLMMERIL